MTLKSFEPYDIGHRRGVDFAGDAERLGGAFCANTLLSHETGAQSSDAWERKYSEGFLAGYERSMRQRAETCHENNLSLWQEA